MFFVIKPFNNNVELTFPLQIFFIWVIQVYSSYLIHFDNFNDRICVINNLKNKIREVTIIEKWKSKEGLKRKKTRRRKKEEKIFL